MVAAVESMFFKGSTPWHGLGQEIPEEKRLSVPDALVVAGCDWEVGKIPLIVASSDDVPLAIRGKEVKAYATYRMTDNTILGDHVGKRYTLYQNRKAFEWFQPYLDHNEAEFHTAGSLNNGKTVWVLAKINRNPLKIVKGDEVEKYLLLSNSHDGTKSIKIGFTPIRVVCVNTLAMAHNSVNSKLLKVRHSARAEQAMEGIRETVDVWNQAFEATAEQYRYLATRGVNQADLETYVKIVLAPKKTYNEGEEVSGKMRGMMEKVFAAMEDPRGGQTAPGSWWAAYNAVTEYLSFDKAVHNNSNRLRELWYGVGAKTNQRALNLALQMAG